MTISDSRMKLAINSLIHFLVDGLCMVILFNQPKEDIAVHVILYNTLAFSTQCLSGMLIDKIGCGRYGILLSSIILASTYFLKIEGTSAIVLIGLSNSFFHVSGGYITLAEAKGKAWPLGVFVAPGCMGLILGKLYPFLGKVFAIVLLLLGLISFLYEEERHVIKKSRRSNAILCVGLLLLAIITRSIGGTAVSFPWKTTAFLSILMTFCVFLGKALGGLLIDKAGIRYVSLLSMSLASVFISFCSQNMYLSLVGQLLINLSMPTTLWLIYGLMPDMPSFAFGVAASALWPGSLMADFISSSSASIFISLIIGLLAILYVEGEMKHD